VRYDAVQGEVVEPVYTTNAGQETTTEEVAVEIVKLAAFELAAWFASPA
jgi:hypothetical protein